MRKILLLLILIASTTIYASVNDVIQIHPRITTSNIHGDDYEEFLEIEMQNTFDVANLQFDLLLPEAAGMTYYDYTFDLDNYDARVYHYKKGKETAWGFSVSTNKLANGYTRFVFTPVADKEGNLHKIDAGEGVFMQIYFSTTSDMSPGIYPILMSNIRLDKSVTETVVIEQASSYVAIGNSNPLATAAHVDLSGMTGYIPSFVVNQLNTDIASNESLKSLNLSGTSFENLGAALNVPNNNNDLLWYTSDKASLNRTFTAGNWSTVCLPFTLETITVNTLLTNGCAVKGMTRYNFSEKTVTFDDVNTMSTGVPYLFKCSDLKTKPFENIDITNPEAISTGPHNVTDNNLTFKGTYELDEPSSTGLITIYGYKNNQFVKVESGQSGKVQPFRAYMELAGGVGTRGFISIDGLDDATGINEIVVPDAEKTTPIYDLQGRKVDGNYHSRGILIQNGKKIIKK